VTPDPIKAIQEMSIGEAYGRSAAAE